MSGATEHVLRNVSFGPAQPFPVEVANEVMDQMAESIVDLARKLEESEARVAVLEEEQKIFKRLLSERLDARVDLAGIADEDKAGVIEGRTGNSPGRSDLSPRTTLPAHILREVIRGDDGDAIYWPTCDHGAYPAHLLRDIAAHLDRLNKEASQ